MNIIENLCSRFRIDAFENPSSEAEIAELIRVSRIPVPDDFLEMIRAMSDAEILIRGTQYVRIWGAARTLELNDAYHIQRYFPISLAIGDDEGGAALIFTDTAQGFGLYKCDFGDLDPDSATFIASSLSEFLISGVGVDAF